jgi:MraZ protein
MSGVAGVYDCKVDEKGRIIVPSELLRQIMPEEMREKFVIRKGVEVCLVLYLEDEWQRKSGEVESLDEYDEEVVEFKRFFYSSVKRIFLDNSNRLLFPKALLDFAEIEKDVVLLCMSNSIEIWSRKNYDEKVPAAIPDERIYTKRILKKRSDSENKK